MQDMLEGDEGLLRRYLLGEATQEEEESLEQRLLEDDRLFQQAEAVEGDLLAEYARGELSPEQRNEVLRRWSASQGGQARLALAQGLARIADERPVATVRPFRKPAPVPVPVPVPVATPRWYRSVAALAAGLLLFVGAPLAYWTAQRNGDDAPKIVHNIGEAPSPSPAPTPAQTPPLSPEPAPDKVQETETERLPEIRVPEQAVTQVFALAFTGATRSGDESYESPDQVLSLKGETEEIDFQVPLAEGEGPYEVVLSTAGDEEIDRKRGLRPESLDSGEKGIRFQVPADKLPTGSNKITVQSAADPLPLIESFEVRRK